MIKSVHDYHIDDLLKADANFYYKIPKYQRAYTWNQYHWKALYDIFCKKKFNGYSEYTRCYENFYEYH